MVPPVRVRSEKRPTRRSLVVAMIVSVGVVLGVGLWSTGREMNSALSRLGGQQAFLALTVAHDLSSRLALFEENARLSEAAGGPPSASRLSLLGSVLQHLLALQREGQMRVLVRMRGDSRFMSSDHRTIESRILHEALDRGETHIVLDRDTAARIGLSRYRAVAGLAQVPVPDHRFPPLQIAVIASAASERERVFRAQWRNALTSLTAIAVVLWFGRLTLAQQRRELDLAARLARAQLERERDEQLARADRFAMLAAMSTGVAHELGSPLSVIVGRIEQLGPLAEGDEAAARALRSMTEQVDRMGGIIRGFLALARGETPILEHTSPQGIVETARELVHHRFERADVHLHVELPPSLPEVALDPRLFTQVLVNLLVNACQASVSGSTVTLRVRVEQDHVVFEVIDQGEGIRADVAKRATEPFFTTRAHDGGTGLGLAIVNEITQQHGGALELVASEPNGARTPGTTARIKLPLLGHQPEAGRRLEEKRVS